MSSKLLISLAFQIVVPAGATVTAQPFIQQFEPPLQALSTNTAITFTVPSLGSGNTVAIAQIEGYRTGAGN